MSPRLLQTRIATAPSLLRRVLATALLSFGGGYVWAADNACLSCHADRERLGAAVGLMQARRLVIVPAAYDGSVHSEECAVCHSGFDDASSGRHSTRPAPVSCGSCHSPQERDWRASIHGEAAASGDANAPRCATCHGVHDIRPVNDPGSPVYRRRLPATCSHCHDAEEIAARYDLPPNRLRTYENSYHGIAVKFGRVTAADCASCHNPHFILPPEDPRSSVNKANLAAVCGKCHPGAGEQFAAGRIHVTATKESSPGMFYVRKFYTYFIGALMVIFIGYIILEHSGAARVRRRKREEQ